MAGQRFLVVVDDAWRSADVEPFRGLGPGALLITTRNGGTLPAGCRRVEVDAMERSEAVRLLTSDLENLDALATRLDALASRLGEWPLLLRLVNRQLRELIEVEGLGVGDAFDTIEEELAASGVTAFDVDDETAREKAVERTLGVSLGRLGDGDRQCFQDLAVFPEAADVPLNVLERFWGLRKRAVRQRCKRLHNLSLLLRFDRAAQTIRLHDMVRQYLVDEHCDLPVLHRRLLKQTRPRSGGWSDLAAGETYLWRTWSRRLVTIRCAFGTSSPARRSARSEATPSGSTRWQCWTRSAWSRRLVTIRCASGTSNPARRSVRSEATPTRSSQ